MKLERRLFSGKNFQPLPEVLFDESLKMFALVTPWGSDEGEGQKILDFLVQNRESFLEDNEKTSLYPPLSGLSEEENSLRSLILACNHWIFQQWNKGQYHFGCELLCGSLSGEKLVFVQVGRPFVFLARPGIPLQILGGALDLSGLLAGKGKSLPPLPSGLLGLFPDTSFSVFSLPVFNKDRLVFISRDLLPTGILSLPEESRTMQGFAQFLTRENQESPFWLGILSF